MRSAGLEEVQAGLKIAGRNINNLRYADDLEHGVAPLGPPVHAQPPLLGDGVAPLSRCHQ